MNSFPLKHLLWKEYRQQIPIVIAVGVFAMVVMITYSLLSNSTRSIHDYQNHGYQNIIPIAIVLACIQALACGVTLFAGENEDGTNNFLRMLPIQSSRIGMFKLISGLFFCFITLLILASTALWLTRIGWMAYLNALPSNYVDSIGYFETRGGAPTYFGEFWARNQLGSFLVCVILPPIEYFAFGALFSLWTRKPLRAALLAVTAWSVLMFFLANTFSDRSNDYFDYRNLAGIWPVRVAMLALISIANVVLARSWLRKDNTQADADSVSSAEAQNSSRKGNWASIYTSLLWLSFRQSWKPICFSVLALALVWLISIFFLTATIPGIYAHEASYDIEPDYSYAFTFATVSLGLIGTLAGIAVFVNDGNQLRFFSQQSEYPTKIWVCRIAPWAIATLIFFVVSATSMAYLYGLAEDSPYHFGLQLSLPFDSIIRICMFAGVVTFCGFGGGQFCSLLFRNSLIASALAVALGIILFAWSFLTSMFELGLVWAVLPIPCGMLFATWWVMPNLLAEGSAKSIWIKISVAILVPVAAIAISIPGVRSNQVPDHTDYVNRELSPFLSHDARQKAKNYVDALEQVPELPDSLYWFDDGTYGVTEVLVDGWLDTFVKETEALFDIIEIANSNFHCYPYVGDYSMGQYWSHPRKLMNLYNAKAEWHERRQELHNAMICYLDWWSIETRIDTNFNYHFPRFLNRIGRWANLPGQTHENLKAGIELLLDEFDKYDKEFFNNKPLRQIANLNEFLAEGEWSESGTTPSKIPLGGMSMDRSTLAKFPWERERCWRIAVYSALVSRKKMRQSGKRLGLLGTQSGPRWERGDWAPNDISERRLERLNFTNPFPVNFDEAVHKHWIDYRRQLILKMALLAWKHEHGEYPDSLSELPIVQKRPEVRDSVDGWEFRFLKDGFENDVYSWPANWAKPIIEKNTPCIVKFPDFRLVEKWFSVSDGNVQTKRKGSFVQVKGQLQSLPRYKNVWQLKPTSSESGEPE